MKALSIKSPWIDKIRDGYKTIETRTWSTKYRGTLILVGSKEPLGPYAGKACCKVKLVNCRPMTKEDEKDAMCEYKEGLYSWMFEDKEKIDPYEQKGAQGLFEIKTGGELNMKINELPIEKKKLKDLKPAPYNPRTITKAKKEALKKSYEEFGFAGIIIWNKKTEHTIGGHQGVEVMRSNEGINWRRSRS